jgi:hypothetical protein
MSQSALLDWDQITGSNALVEPAVTFCLDNSFPLPAENNCSSGPQMIDE